MTGNEETRRILEMVESGRISAAEGAKLMDSVHTSPDNDSNVCPYCAESIPAQSVLCPECNSNLASKPTPRSPASTGFQALSGLGKFLVIYTLLVSGFELLDLFSSFRMAGLAGSLLSGLGLASGILILKNRSVGWGLGMLWAGLQIVTVILHGQIINQQIFHLGMNFHTYGQGLGINLVGIILLILFIKAKPAVN